MLAPILRTDFGDPVLVESTHRDRSLRPRKIGGVMGRLEMCKIFVASGARGDHAPKVVVLDPRFAFVKTMSTMSLRRLHGVQW